MTQLATRFTIKKGNVSPPLEATLMRDGTPFVLTGYAVKFRYKLAGGIGAATERAMTVTNNLAGMVRYDWVPEDTAVPGVYYVEFLATDSNGDETTFPNQGYNEMVVESTL